MTPKEFVQERLVPEFSRRRFSAGLLVAFVDLLSHLKVPDQDLSSFKALLKRYPRVEKVRGGGRANTLVLQETPGQTISLRPFYNEAERIFRSEHKRFDYPSCAPHATQCWQDYLDWLDALIGFDADELAELRELTIAFVLERLPSQAFDPSSVEVEPPLFKRVLEAFDLSVHEGEKTGAAFQGLAFGFLRADNPHLQIEIDKVRTGSRRLQRVGDVDGWDGKRLAITAEVKQFRFEPKNVSDVHAFANAARQRGAIGMVLALGFEAEAREQIELLGVRPLDVDDLLGIVALWDPLKQRTAVRSMLYYAAHVEKNSALANRLTAFLDDESKPEENAAASNDAPEA